MHIHNKNTNTGKRLLCTTSHNLQKTVFFFILHKFHTAKLYKWPNLIIFKQINYEFCHADIWRCASNYNKIKKNNISTANTLIQCSVQQTQPTAQRQSMIMSQNSTSARLLDCIRPKIQKLFLLYRAYSINICRTRDKEIPKCTEVSKLSITIHNRFTNKDNIRQEA